MSTRRRACLLGAVLAGGCCGCGAAPPQPPAVQSARIASALSGITSACGEYHQQRAFAARPEVGGHPTPAALEAAAGERAVELARAYRANPAWVYQNETLTKIVAEAVRDLNECGLSQAAARLQRLAR